MTYAEHKGYLGAVHLLPPELREFALSLPDRLKDAAEELRLRAGFPMTVLLPGGEQSLPSAAQRRTVTPADLSRLLEIATGASAHSAQAAIARGFVTVKGGYRLGLCGTAVTDGGRISGFRALSSASLRIPGEARGCASEIFDSLCPAEGTKTPPSVLVISVPGGGKTTFLRDLVRLLSEAGRRVSLADERGEIAAVWEGFRQFDVGPHTDVLTGGSKSEAIMLLLRSMNPEIIALDEVTAAEDAAAIAQASYCGVGLVATAHACDIPDLESRPLYRSLLDMGVFTRCVIITGVGDKRVYRLEKL